MKKLYSALAVFATAGMVAATVAIAAPPQDRPNATAVFSTETVAVGVRYTWGRGVLKFKGHSYPFKIDGLGAVGVGVDKVHGVAEVYHLKSPADFAGTYGRAAIGASLGKAGGESSTMSNEHGVVMNVHARERGIQINLGVGGVHIKLSKR
ncbi:hypothetical protein D9M73_153920 [compost metagenome]|uniref:hypothetical protein n=2 Tax=Sphingomonas TaxID=13687 RepID=UPI001AEA358B